MSETQAAQTMEGTGEEKVAGMERLHEHELFETVQGRTLVESAEERGWVDPAELEALALELDLHEEELADFQHEL